MKRRNDSKIKEKVSKVKRDISSENINKGINILNLYKKKQSVERNSRIGKTVDEYADEQDERSYEKKNLNFKPLILCFIIILVVLAVYLFFEFGPLLGISINKGKGMQEENRIDIVSTDQDIYTMYNSELLVYSNQMIRTYSNNSEETFEFKLPEVFAPGIYIKGRYMAVTNKSNGKIYLFEGKNEILDQKIDGTIQKVYLDGTGNYAVEYSTVGFKKIIGVYDKSGTNLYNAYLDTNAIIDLQLTSNAQKLLIAQADTSSLTIGVSIKEIDGTKSSDNIKEIVKLDNSLLFNLTIQGQNIIMLLDNKIVKYNIETGVLDTIKNFDKMQVSFVTISNNYFAILEDTTTEDTLQGESHNYMFETKRFDSNSISKVQMTNLPKLIKNSGILTYMLYQDKVQVVNKWGVNVKNISLNFPPKEIVIFNNEKSVALIYSNKIYIVNI